MAWHSWFSVWFLSAWDTYTDLWAGNWFWALVVTLLLWCQLSHCLLQPCCTCIKKENKLKKNLFKGGSHPWGVIAAHRGGSLERLENTLEAYKNAVA